MKVARLDGDRFSLVAETAEDEDFAGALYVQRHVQYLQPVSLPRDGGHAIVGALVQVSSSSPDALRAEAGGQALRSLGNLLRLGLREAADHGHVGALAADPQAQEPLAAGVVQLQLVLQALGLEVVQKEAVRQMVAGTHEDPSSVEGGNRDASADAGQWDLHGFQPAGSAA